MSSNVQTGFSGILGLMDAYLENTRAAPEHRNTQRFFVSGSLSEEDLFETLNTQVFVEEPATSTGLTLLTDQ